MPTAVSGGRLSLQYLCLFKSNSPCYNSLSEAGTGLFQPFLGISSTLYFIFYIVVTSGSVIVA